MSSLGACGRVSIGRDSLLFFFFFFSKHSHKLFDILFYYIMEEEDDFDFEDDDDDKDYKGVGLSLHGVVDPVSQLNLSTDFSFTSSIETTPPSPGVTKLNRQLPMFPATPPNNGNGIVNGNGMNGFHGGGNGDLEDICRRTKENIEERLKILQEVVKANDLRIYNEKMNGLAANYVSYYPPPHLLLSSSSSLPLPFLLTAVHLISLIAHFSSIHSSLIPLIFSSTD
jgi:hypothetical protein